MRTKKSNDVRKSSLKSFLRLVSEALHRSDIGVLTFPSSRVGCLAMAYLKSDTKIAQNSNIRGHLNNS